MKFEKPQINVSLVKKDDINVRRAVKWCKHLKAVGIYACPKQKLLLLRWRQGMQRRYRSDSMEDPNPYDVRFPFYAVQVAQAGSST